MAQKSDDGKCTHLDQLSTEQLEEFLRVDIESTEQNDMGMIFRILEVIEEREAECPTGRIPDQELAWAEFQQYYNIPEGEGLSLYPNGPSEDEDGRKCATKNTDKHINLRRALRYMRVAVAAAMVFLMGVVAAQAAGIDVFGALGRWTEETFRFVTTEEASQPAVFFSDPESAEYHEIEMAALAECGIEDDLAPTWYPAGLKMASSKIIHTDLSDNIYWSFTGNEGMILEVCVRRFFQPQDMRALSFEKDGTCVESYTADGRTFYIMSNLDNITAAWSDGRSLVMNLSGNLPGDNLKNIINSIGGQPF